MSARPFSAMGGTQWDTVVWGSLLAFRGGCPAPFSPRPLSSTPAPGPLGLAVSSQAQTEEVNLCRGYCLCPARPFGQTIWTFKAAPCRMGVLVSDKPVVGWFTTHAFHPSAILVKGLLCFFD